MSDNNLSSSTSTNNKNIKKNQKLKKITGTCISIGALALVGTIGNKCYIGNKTIVNSIQNNENIDTVKLYSYDRDEEVYTKAHIADEWGEVKYRSVEITYEEAVEMIYYSFINSDISPIDQYIWIINRYGFDLAQEYINYLSNINNEVYDYNWQDWIYRCLTTTNDNKLLSNNNKLIKIRRK